MKPRKLFPIVIIIFTLMLSLACSLSGETQPEPGNAATKIALTVAAIDQPAQPATQAPGQPPIPTTHPLEPIPTLAPTLAPSTPTSLQSTLASLDSYRFILKYHKSGNKPTDTSIIDITLDQSDKDDAVHSLFTLQNPIKLSDTDAETSPTTAEVWSKDNITCTKDEDGEYSSEKQTDTESDNTQDLLDLLDIVPRIDNPEFVGAETINDIPSNHFKFKIANYMADSGWLVTRNEGEYWLALDGQYIVKYSLFLDASSAPESNPKAEILKVSISQELQNINKPVDINIPASCPAPSSSD